MNILRQVFLFYFVFFFIYFIYLEYYEVVARSLGRSSEKCTVDIKTAFESVEELLAAPGGPEKLKVYFK